MIEFFVHRDWSYVDKVHVQTNPQGFVLLPSEQAVCYNVFTLSLRVQHILTFFNMIRLAEIVLNLIYNILHRSCAGRISGAG